MTGPHPRPLVPVRGFSLSGRGEIALAGLCLLAFGLRVARLDFHPIWFDEDLAYQRATASLTVSLASMAGSPLYYILLRGWVELTGTSLYALRYFSALCGTLTIPLLYQLIRRLLDKRVALATAIIAILAPFYIYYSQEARTYSLTLVLMLVSMYAFLRWLDTRNAWALAVCCLANLTCLYTHYVAGLVMAAQGIMLLLTCAYLGVEPSGGRSGLQQSRLAKASTPVRKSKVSRWMDVLAFGAAHAGVGLAFLPWLWRVWNLLPRVLAPTDSKELDAWSILARTWTEFSVGRTLAPPLSLYLAMVPLFLALAGLLSLFDTRGDTPHLKRRRAAAGFRPSHKAFILQFSNLAILVWLVVPIVGSLLVPRASVRFSPKYLIAVTPVYYTLIVLGLGALRKESRALFWVCVIALIGISLYSLGDYYLRQHDKLAQMQRGFAKVTHFVPLQVCPLFAEHVPGKKSQHVFEVTHRRVAYILCCVRLMRTRLDFSELLPPASRRFALFGSNPSRAT